MQRLLQSRGYLPAGVVLHLDLGDPELDFGGVGRGRLVMDLSRILGVPLGLDQFASLQQIESVGENIARDPFLRGLELLECVLAFQEQIAQHEQRPLAAEDFES
jgi:hypothetical protein